MFLAQTVHLLWDMSTTYCKILPGFWWWPPSRLLRSRSLSWWPYWECGRWIPDSGCGNPSSWGTAGSPRKVITNELAHLQLKSFKTLKKMWFFMPLIRISNDLLKITRLPMSVCPAFPPSWVSHRTEADREWRWRMAPTRQCKGCDASQRWTHPCLRFLLILPT